METDYSKIIKKQSGFTMIEIVAVLVVLGILVAVTVSRFQDDQNVIPTVEAIKSHIRYAQSQSMNTGTIWGIQCSASQLSLFRGNVATQITLPGEDNTAINLSQRDVNSIGNFNIYFDNWGIPYSGTPVNLIGSNELSSEMTITVNSSYNIRIMDETGYVR